MNVARFATRGHMMIRPTTIHKIPATVRLTAYNMRMFGLTRYKFDDEDWVRGPTQLSVDTHLTNAEELINELPIIEVHGSIVRCTGVNERGLGHPVQYI